MPVDVSHLLVQLIGKILTNPATAFQFASDGNGTLAAQGITEGDLSGLDMPGLVEQACQTYDVPADARYALQGYTSGSPSYSGPVSPPASSYTSGPQSMEQVVQHLNYVTYAAYEGDTNIQQTILDQSTDINVGDDFEGDIDVHNAAATGDGAVAGSGDGDVTAATGDGSQAINDSTIGQNQNNSPGAVQVGEDAYAPIVTGDNTGVIADDSNVDAVIGDHNQTVQTDGPVDDSVFNFGEGDVQQVNDSTVTHSAIGGDDATNVSGNAMTGSAVSTGDGDAEGNFETTNVQAHDSIVATEQGDGDLQQYAEQEQEDEEPEPEPQPILD
jgi:hypothetical protein